jgi:hypothetical protein
MAFVSGIDIGQTCTQFCALPQLVQLLAALRGNQIEINPFFGMNAGTVSIPEFFSTENIERIMAQGQNG